MYIATKFTVFQLSFACKEFEVTDARVLCLYEVLMFCVFVFVAALQGRDLRKRWAGTADSDTTVAEMEEL